MTIIQIQHLIPNPSNLVIIIMYKFQSLSQPLSTLLFVSLTIASPILSSTQPALSQTEVNTEVNASEIRTDKMRRTPAASVIQAVRQAVRQQFGVQKVAVTSISEQNWPDGCLGLPRGKEACTMAIVPGWRVQVTDQLQTWVYRTDRTGKILRLENPNRAVLPQAIARKLIQQVAKDTNTLARNFRITEAKAQEYNGCLGIYRPDQACTAQVIPSWQAIITGPKQTFVYHLSQTGEQIVRNETASGAKRDINVSFIESGMTSSIVPPEIFRSLSSGGLTGGTTSLVLTQDGKITRYTSSLTGKIAPVVIKTLSASQVNAFQKMLDDRQFPNLNGLSYTTSAALADYPTTTYQSQYTTVQFIDLEKKSLPRSLQSIIATWESNLKP